MSEEFQSRVLDALAELQQEQAELRGGLAGLQEGFAEQRVVLGRVGGKVDRVAAEMTTVRSRLTTSEMEKASGDLRSAALQACLDNHEVRLTLIERRLELRDK